MDWKSLVLAVLWVGVQGFYAWSHSQSARRMEAAGDRLAHLQPGTIAVDVDAAVEKFGPIVLQAAEKLAAMRTPGASAESANQGEGAASA